ncbi:hypothetical protein MRX96_034232 [Rhipicephalus microplus]
MLRAVGIGPLAVARLTVELTTTGERAKLHRLLVLSFLALKQLLNILFGATSNNLLVPVGGLLPLLSEPTASCLWPENCRSTSEVTRLAV